jgi:hypothetical protein
MATISITSNDGALQSASAVLEVTATNPEYNQPALRIKQAGRRGGAASIRIDDPNPDIEFVETGLPGTDPNAGKFEIAVQADQLQINGRKADVGPNKGFETIVVFTRPAAGGNIGFGFPEAHYEKFGGGKGVIVIANASVAPTRNIAGAGILYVEDGASSIGVRMERSQLSRRPRLRPSCERQTHVQERNRDDSSLRFWRAIPWQPQSSAYGKPEKNKHVSNA